MRKTIEFKGKKHIYDTSKAEALGNRAYSYYGDPAGYEETLYKTKGGLYCETCNKSRANRQRALDSIASGKSVPLTDYSLLVKEWDDEDDISLYTRGSDKKARWKCSECGNVFYQVIKNRTLQGQGCPLCAAENRRRTDPNQITFDDILNENGDD